MSANITWPSDVTDVSTTLLDLVDTADQLGALRQEGNKWYRLVCAGGTIGDGGACAFATDGGGARLEVIAAAAGSVGGVAGFNNTGAARSAGDYFWALVDGIGYALTDATIAAYVACAVDSTTAACIEAAATTEAVVFYTTAARTGAGLVAGRALGLSGGVLN